MTQSEAGKGSKRRPMQISDEQYAKNYDAIFQRDICNVCGRELVNGLCPEQERNQKERT